MAFFSTIRLSKHFLLLDFLNGHTLYSSGRPLLPSEITAQCIRTGQRLCEELLEPIIEYWGPVSISNGYIPKDLLSGRWTPHTWFPQDGAAADVIVHNWVNEDFAPIKLVEAMVYRQLPFERLITYAGSEVVCMAAGRSPKNRGAIYENVRIPGSPRPQFVTWSRGGPLRADMAFPARDDWRRGENEPVYHTKNSLRPQHIRVGEYFVALDFFRNEAAIQSGTPWVFRPRNPATLVALQCMAEVLDRVVRQVGRISITRGVTRPGSGVLDNHTWDGETFSVEFALPLGSVTPTFEHPAVTGVKWREAPDGTPRCTLTVTRFKPARLRSSAVQPVAKSLDKQTVAH